MDKNNLTREFKLQSEQEQGGAKKYSVSFASQTPYERWFGNEILEVTPEAVDLTRLCDIGCVLFNHDPGKVIGKPENIRIDGGKAYCDITFDDDAFSQDVMKKVEGGTLKGVSVSYTVDEWESVKEGQRSLDGKFEGAAKIARKWMPYEISIVSVPADASVGVNRSHEANDNIRAEKQEGNTLNENENTQAVAPDTRAVQGDDARAAQGERKRAAEIVALGKSTGLDLTEHITRGSSVDEVRKFAIEELTKSHKPLNIKAGTDDNRENLFKAMGDGLALRAGIIPAKPAQGCGDFRNMTLRELAVEACERAGQSGARNLSTDELYLRAFTPDVALGSILTNTVNASIAKAYASTPLTFSQWTGVGSLSNFKPTEFWRISEAGELDVVKQNGEFKRDEVSDEKVSIKLETKGLEWGFTRQAMINDDLGVLSRIPQAYIQSALRGVNKAVYSILNTNPAIYDGKALFDATDHENLATVGGGITTATLSAARTAMRKHKNARKLQALNITPAFLIVAPEMEQEAMLMIKSMAKPDGAHAGIINTFENSMRIVVDGELTGNSGKEWFLAGDPSMIDGIIVSYLNGNQMPQLFTQAVWNGQGVKWAINYDVGVNIVDYRGLYKNPGAATK